MATSADIAIVTGAFTLGGVLLTGVGTSLASLLRRRWAAADAREGRKNARIDALRTERIKAYRDLLHAFNAYEDHAVLLMVDIRAGRKAAVRWDEDPFAHGTEHIQ